MTYRLDDLGWFQFEELIQSLLKVHFEAAIEAWGGSHDWGRDAFYQFPLPFPDARNMASAPLVFQTKFVTEANAAGANSQPAVIKAIKADAALQAQRKRRLKTGGTYVLFTNAPLSASFRQEVTELIKELYKPTQAFAYGCRDVCNWLDNAPQLRNAFPQLLSLRDLQTLLQNVVAKPTMERSKVFLQLAHDLSQVFVPSKGYSETWQKLARFNFVVLEGPPEVGKTAIARMIALTQHCQGWDAFECRMPDDVLQLYDASGQQVFVADDAFGTTEYDPTSTGRWGRDIERLLRMMDNRHWLLWTSRKHILQIALKHTHTQGIASAFPEPGDVLVDVGQMEQEEKALILYRHAKAARLDEKHKRFIRNTADAVVNSPYFTPERIRRFVHNRLASLVVQADCQELLQKQVLGLAQQEMKEPTLAMLNSYRALSLEHQCLLISMLDANDSFILTRKSLKEAYERQKPENLSSSFETVSTDLLDAFIHFNDEGMFGGGVKWIHPSLRDLVIEEVSQSPYIRRNFLLHCGPTGLRLSLSHGGGAEGKRSLPFLHEPADWDSMRTRLEEIAEKGGHGTISAIIAELGAVAQDANSPAASRKEFRAAIATFLEAVVKVWEAEQKPIRLLTLRQFFQLSLYSPTWINSPNLMPTWEYVQQQLVGDIEEYVEHSLYEGAGIKEMAEFIDICRVYQPRLLAYVGWPKVLDQRWSALASIVEDYESWISNVDPDNAEIDASITSHVNEFAGSLKLLCESHERIKGLLENKTQGILDANQDLERYFQRKGEDRDYEPDDLSLHDRRQHSTIADIFTDL